jgi:hypothetical protein
MSFVKAYNQFRDQLRGVALINPDNSWNEENLRRYDESRRNTRAVLNAPTTSTNPSSLADYANAQRAVQDAQDRDADNKISFVNRSLEPRARLLAQDVDADRARADIQDGSYKDRISSFVEPHRALLGDQHGQERWVVGNMSQQLADEQTAYYALNNKIADATIADMNKGPSFMENLGSIGGLLSSILGGVALFRG